MSAPMARRTPCAACPYRRDSPPGLWAREEYAKLPPYDGETWAQPVAAFYCHATPRQLCHGWVVVGGENLLALRLVAARAGRMTLPAPSVSLFTTHAEAAEHGMSAIDRPPPAALVAASKLRRQHRRLRRIHAE